MKPVLLLLCLGLFGTSAMAQVDYKTKTVVVDRATGARFKAKEKGYIDFGGWKHVEKMKIKVNGPIPGLRLWANNQEYTPVYVPGARPYYQASIGAAVSAIDVYADSDCRFDGIVLNSIDHVINAPRGYGGFYSADAARELALIEDGVQALRYRFEDEKFITFLRPILDAIAQAQIMQYSRGEIAQQSLNAIDAVIAQVDFAADFLKTCLKIDSDRMIAIELLSAKERLSMMRGR